MARTYEPIASTTLGSAASTVTFSSLPSTFSDLVFVYSVTNGTSDFRGFTAQFNSDSASNYSGTYLGGDGSSAGSGRLSSQSKIYVGRYLNINGRQIGRLSLMSYANTSVFKTLLNEAANNEDSSASKGVWREVGLWRSTSAISSVVFTAGSPGSFGTGSTFSLYGIKAA